VVRKFSIILLAVLFAVWLPFRPACGEQEAATEKENTADAPRSSQAAVDRLKLPGINIDLEEWCVDVESHVCLREGSLELIACTKGTKEHESIVSTTAKPSHIHAALLLIGAKPGNPAMREAIDEAGTRFIDLPPKGDRVEVFLVLGEDKKSEMPINEFIVPNENLDETREADENKKDQFPTHSFLFAGSVLYGEGEGPRRYLCDQSGNMISISTFGDELLCLPGIHSHANGMLEWQVDGAKLPEVGSKVTLRLRPQVKRKPTPKSDCNQTEE